MQKRFVLLGASRGLGWATFQLLQDKPYASAFLLSSRKIIKQANDRSPSETQLLKGKTQQEIKLVEQDFSKVPLDPQFIKSLEEFNPTDLIYFAGGGPYGNYSDKKWSDHQWALNTTFMYPAELVHQILQEKKNKWSQLKNLILIGSSVAESKPDPKAASYAAAKHALKGLVETIQLEMAGDKALLGDLRLQLFSPGYMQTDLLPAHSEPRQKQWAENPLDVAKKLITMIEKTD